MKNRGGWFSLGLIAGALSFSCSSGTSTQVDEGGEGATKGAGATPRVCTLDSECDDGRFCNGEETCDPDAKEADELGCVAAESPCGEGQDCLELAESCRSRCDVTRDADGDGHEAVECGGDDCDDADPNRFPGNFEICDVNHHDEDCDPQTYGFRDQDGDAVGDANCCNELDGELGCGSDCNDLNRSVHPTASEVCDGVDNNCNDEIDEGVEVVLTIDSDGDGFGDSSPDAEKVEACPDTKPGFVLLATDCDDREAEVHPSAAEYCDSGENQVDENCDGDVNEGCECEDGETTACCGTGTRVCNALTGIFSEACSITPTDEICDGEDNDCDGLVDEGFGCRQGSQPIDCTTASGVPGQRQCNAACALDVCVGEEICNGLDDDGDAAPDEGFECVQGDHGVPCITSCGTQGTGTCGDDCSSVLNCAAPGEWCNYCDDNGIAGFLDEKPQLIAMGETDEDRLPTVINCGKGEHGNAKCDMLRVNDSSQDLWISLIDGSESNQTGTVWPLVNDRMGWGTIEVEFTLEVRGASGLYDDSPPNIFPAPKRGGFSISLTGAAPGLDAARGTSDSQSNLSFRYEWGHKSLFQPPPGQAPEFYEATEENDRHDVRGRSGTVGINGQGSNTPEAEIWTSRSDTIGADSWVSYPIYLAYTPDDPSTPLLNEEEILVKNGKDGAVLERHPEAHKVGDLNYAAPDNEVPVGAPLSIAIGAYSEGVPYEARLKVGRLTVEQLGGHFYWDYSSFIYRTEICPYQLP